MQKQAWSPDLLNQKSPSVFSPPTGLWFFVFDFPPLRGLGIGWGKEFKLSYVEIFSVIVLTLCKVQFEGNRKTIVDRNRKIKWHKIRERWDLSEPGLFSPLEPFNHWKLSGHLNTCPNRLNSMGRAITFINQVGSHPRKSLQAQIDGEYLRCNVMLYGLTYVNGKVNWKSSLSVMAWKTM